jgi:hypothetical protein
MIMRKRRADLPSAEKLAIRRKDASTGVSAAIGMCVRIDRLHVAMQQRVGGRREGI